MPRNLLPALLILLTFTACREPEEFAEERYDERLSGGAQTVFSEGVGAFSSAFPTLSGDREEFHELGDLHFEATFVAAPAPKFQGLGTVYNSNACFNCHINDGRGKPILGNEALSSMLFRVSVPGADQYGGPLPAPGYGTQLQDKAVYGYAPEGTMHVNWIETIYTFPDGQQVRLRHPEWTMANAYQGVPAGMLYSPRVAPPVHGLGLLEQVDESTILSFADPYDSDGDGISGKPNYVWDAKSQQKKLGRFGWKCDAPTLDHQVAAAYNEDMGITSDLMPIENSYGQPQHSNASPAPEVLDSVFEAVLFYVKTLAVPARRKVTDPLVKRGKIIFQEARCASCHIPSMYTKVDVSFPEASNQFIHPYTDLLLHDMGPALSDNRPVYDATGNEWRTPPLWGIGLTQLVNGHQFYLHDGRARTLMEAILWHGGEAQPSADHVRRLSQADRDALIAFVRSL